MQARSGSGLPDPLMTGGPGAAGMRWLWALVADGDWLAGEGQGTPARHAGHLALAAAEGKPGADPRRIGSASCPVARSGAAPRHITLAGLCYPVSRRIFVSTSEIIARTKTVCMTRCLPEKDSSVSARQDSAAIRDPVMSGSTCPAGRTFPGRVSS